MGAEFGKDIQNWATILGIWYTGAPKQKIKFTFPGFKLTRVTRALGLFPAQDRPEEGVQFLPPHTFSLSASILSRNLCQKSLKSGLSIFFRLSFVGASTLTYNCVTGFNDLKITKIKKSGVLCMCIDTEFDGIVIV